MATSILKLQLLSTPTQDSYSLLWAEPFGEADSWRKVSIHEILFQDCISVSLRRRHNCPRSGGRKGPQKSKLTVGQTSKFHEGPSTLTIGMIMTRFILRWPHSRTDIEHNPSRISLAAVRSFLCKLEPAIDSKADDK